MVPRPRPLLRIEEQFGVHPVVALLGPRQCGKTTLARAYAGQERSTYFDLENPVDQRRLSEAPMTVLEELSDLVIVDEVQRLPWLFELIRVLVDRPDYAARFLLLGSASPDLVRGVSESLAGRIGFVNLGGFDVAEVGSEAATRLWVRGGFPRSFLARDDRASRMCERTSSARFWNAIIPRLGISIPAETLRRFWVNSRRLSLFCCAAR